MPRIDTLLEGIPDAWPENLQPVIRTLALASGITLVVLDDDPTGTQTVHDVPVITTWKEGHIRQLLADHVPLFYILTNSRGCSAEEAREINRAIAKELVAAKAETGRAFAVISRSDSTLRGHYPLETDVLAEALSLQGAPVLLIPFFEEGGRVTITGVHYVVEDGHATPASETPFALDAVFGFSHAHLPSWVEEKTKGKIRADQVRSISLPMIREGGPAHVSAMIESLRGGDVCVVNAVTMRDMEVVAMAMHQHWERGGQMLVRSAASIVRALAGLPKKPLLEARDLVLNQGHGGLIVVGSHVPKSTTQLERLQEGSDVLTVMLDVEESAHANENIAAAIQTIDETITNGRDVVLATSREVVLGRDDQENMRISQRVSEMLVRIVSGLRATPRFLIAKGGITSSDIASRALGVKVATVLGQLLPGVPVWRLGEETRFPGLGFVVFPGNVGDDNALLASVRRLQA